MRGETIVLVGVMIGALVVLAIDLARGVRRRFRVRKLYSISCPARGVRVRCTMLQDECGVVGDVASCSEFHPRGEVTCDRTCVAYLNMLGRRRPQPIA